MLLRRAPNVDIDSSPCLQNSQAVTNPTVWGMPLWVCWVIIAILLLISAIYSASENAFSNCNKYHFKSLAAKGNRTAKLITRLVDHFDGTLITVLVGNNIIQTLMSFLSAMLFYNICEIYGLGDGVEAILSTVVMAFLIYIVSDTVPKIISKAMPNKMAIFLTYPVIITEILLFPVIFIFRSFLKLVHKLFKVKEQNLLSKEDILHSVSLAINDENNADEENEEKLFEKDETQILDNVFSFDKLAVKKVYTPKEKVFSLSVDDLNTKKVNEVILNTNFSRIPIYDGETDNIIGILVTKIYFEEYAKDKHLSIPSILEPAVFLESSLPLDEAFDTLNSEKVHLGIVKENDRYIGIISMEDILEELVDDIDEAPIKKGEKA